MSLPITLSFKLSFEMREKVIKLMRPRSSIIHFIHNGRNLERERVAKNILQSAWQVLRVAVPFLSLAELPQWVCLFRSPCWWKECWIGVMNMSALVDLAGAGS